MNFHPDLDCLLENHKESLEICEKAQQVKVFAAKLDGLSLMPRTKMVEREITPSICPLISIRTCWDTHGMYMAYNNKQTNKYINDEGRGKLDKGPDINNYCR